MTGYVSISNGGMGDMEHAIYGMRKEISYFLPYVLLDEYAGDSNRIYKKIWSHISYEV